MLLFLAGKVVSFFRSVVFSLIGIDPAGEPGIAGGTAEGSATGNATGSGVGDPTETLSEKKRNPTGPHDGTSAGAPGNETAPTELERVDVDMTIISPTIADAISEGKQHERELHEAVARSMEPTVGENQILDADMEVISPTIHAALSQQDY